VTVRRFVAFKAPGIFSRFQRTSSRI
jgi:hypothetical protein